MGILSSLFDIIKPAAPFIAAAGQGFNQESYADDLRETARMLFNLPNNAGLDNSWEQINPIIQPSIDRVNNRFDDFYNSETAFLDRVGGNLDEWLGAGSSLNDRLTEIANRPAPEFLRPDFESYLPEQITSLDEIPGFQLASQNLERATGRSLASQGYGQSGNILNAVAENLGQLGLTAYGDEMNRRNSLFGARATADVARYNSDINAYQAGVEGALAPLELLADNITTTIGHLTGLRSNTASGIGSSINAQSDFTQATNNSIMDYLAQAQSDRAGLYGSIADSVGQLYSDAGALDATQLDALARLLGSGEGRGGIGDALDGVEGLFGAGGALEGLMSGGGALARTIGSIFGLGGAGGAAATTAPITGAMGSGIGEVLSGGELLGQGGTGFSNPFSSLFSGGEGGLGNAMSSFNNWFSGPGGTIAGFALPAGLFASASMRQRGERQNAERLASTATQAMEAAPAGSAVPFSAGGQQYMLLGGSRHNNRVGRFHRLHPDSHPASRNGYTTWLVINSDGSTSTDIAEIPEGANPLDGYIQYGILPNGHGLWRERPAEGPAGSTFTSGKGEEMTIPLPTFLNGRGEEGGEAQPDFNEFRGQ